MDAKQSRKMDQPDSADVFFLSHYFMEVKKMMVNVHSLDSPLSSSWLF